MSTCRYALVFTAICFSISGAFGCSGGSKSAGTGGEGGGVVQSSGGGQSSSASTGGAPSSGSGLGTTVGDCFQYTGWDGMTPAVTFKADVLPIFRASCSTVMTCHGSEIPPIPNQHFYGTPTSAGAMSAAQIQEIFAGAVGVSSVDDPDMDVVKVGDPEHSFMMYKLDANPNVDCSRLTCNASASCLPGMPYLLPPLSLETRDTIRRWIAQGAKND